jgi:hypothetical protein
MIGNNHFTPWKFKTSSRILLIIVFVYSISILTDSISKSEAVEPKMFLKESSPFGTPYGNWLAKWWQWNVAIPLEGHPRDSFSPEKCNTNQNGPVWFLPDILTGSEERSCTIPAGKAVFIPINVGICWNDGNPQYMDDPELRNCAMEGQEGNFMSVYLNGTKLNDSDINRIQSSFFNVTIPADSYTRYNKDASGQILECGECPVGTFRAMADGYFLFLEPMNAGTNDIKYSYDTISNPNPEYRHAASMVYHLIVEPSP